MPKARFVAFDQIGDLTFDQWAFLVGFGDRGPWIGFQAFQAQPNSLALTIDIQDVDPDLVPHGKEFAGMGNMSPRKLGEMDESVGTAQIDKGTKVAQTDHLAITDIAFLQ